VGIALLGAIGVMLFGRLTTAQVVSYVNWPTICLLFGFFVISAQLQLSGFYNLVAGGISARLNNPARFLFILMAVTAGLSAFLNHDIVCYVFTPIVTSALLRKQLNPVPFLVALAIASNIGSGATLIGNADTPFAIAFLGNDAVVMGGSPAVRNTGRLYFWGTAPPRLNNTVVTGEVYTVVPTVDGARLGVWAARPGVAAWGGAAAAW